MADYQDMRIDTRKMITSISAAAVVAFSGCGSDDAPTLDIDIEGDGHGDETEDMDRGHDAEATDEAEEADHVFTYTIADGVADPQLEQQRVAQGSTVRIEVTTDVADELHLHGYDETADVAAGETAVIEFTADLTGRFELETHDSGLTLLDLLVE